MNLHERVGATTPGRMAQWLARLIYYNETHLERIPSLGIEPKPTIPQRLREIADYLEGLAFEELKRNDNVEWVRQLLEIESKQKEK